MASAGPKSMCATKEVVCEKKEYLNIFRFTIFWDGNSFFLKIVLSLWNKV